MGESSDEGDYEHGEARSLEELWWHEELLWSTDNHRQEHKKSRKNEDETTLAKRVANAKRGVILEVKSQPNAHARIGPAAPSFPTKLLTSPEQLVGLPTELVGWLDQLLGLVASLVDQHSPSLPHL